jgi:hypothetical protein
MGRLLKGVHIALLLLLMIYSGKEIVRWIIKIVNPSDESVRFWRPGPELVVTAFSFVLLLGILACSTGAVKNPSWRLLGILHGAWLVCFTWFGWFSVGGPFTLQELVGVDLSDAAAVRCSEMRHFLGALVAYFVIVLISSIPLLMRRFGGHETSCENPAT